jgi:hypothetical protein
MSVSPLHLSYDALGRLVLEVAGGERFAGVVPVRCFPFSAPSERVSFVDERGKEVYALLSLAELPDAERALLEQDLANRDFLPVIKKIYSVSLGADPTLWHVDTDRGEITFALPSEDDVRRLGLYGAIIADTHGVRYRILDTRALDKSSRRILSRYL